MTQQYIGTKQITAWPQENDGQEGYAVKYEDGYTSWSPKAVFEAAYLPMGHVGHMPPYQQRVVGERVLLDDKIEKLRSFFFSKLFGGLASCEQDSQVAQLGAMREYSRCLSERIAFFEGSPASAGEAVWGKTPLVIESASSQLTTGPCAITLTAPERNGAALIAFRSDQEILFVMSSVAARNLAQLAEIKDHRGDDLLVDVLPHNPELAENGARNISLETHVDILLERRLAKVRDTIANKAAELGINPEHIESLLATSRVDVGVYDGQGEAQC